MGLCLGYRNPNSFVLPVNPARDGTTGRNEVYLMRKVNGRPNVTRNVNCELGGSESHLWSGMTKIDR